MGTKYNPSVVRNGLVLYLDAANSRSYSGSGLTAFGMIGGIGGTLVNGVGFTTDNNGSFFFDGSNDYINVANPSDVQLTTGTICVWSKTSAPGSGYRGVVAKQFAYSIFYLNNYLTVYDWAIPRSNQTAYNLADGNWYHLSFTFQNGTANGSVLYLNGAGILTTTYTISSNSYNLYIGGEANSNQFANCNIGQVQIYNRALTAQEILQNYNATKKRYL